MSKRQYSPRIDGSVEDRFWTKVRLNGPTPKHCPELGRCWIWTAYKHPQAGYGSVHLKGRPVAAHRVAWYLVFGKIPKGLCVLHKCDQRDCVKPYHLFLGTKQDNTTDMIQKGRKKIGKACSGEQHYAAKLHEHEVREVIRRVRDGELQISIAKSLNVSAGHIANIVRGRCWKCLALS